MSGSGNANGQSANGDSGSSPDEIMRRAEAAIAALRGDFLQWLSKDLSAMEFELACAMEAPDQMARALSRIREISHNIKGQGGSFGMAALSDTASSLNELLKRQIKAAEFDLEPVRTHLGALRKLAAQAATTLG
jgi:chemotaxis protein histidine kinase CheA